MKHKIKSVSGKQLLSLVLVVFCMLSLIHPTNVFAAGKTDKESKLENYFHVLFDSSGDASGIGVMVNVQNQGIFAYAWSGDSGASKSVYLGDVANNQLYGLSSCGSITVKDETVYVFLVQGISSGAGASEGVMKSAPIVNGEQLEIWYLGSDGNNLRYYYDQLSLSTNYKDNQDGSAFFGLSRALTDIWGLPGLVLNASGNCVGVLCYTDVLYNNWFDAVAFSGNAGNNGGNNGGDSGGNNGGDSGGNNGGDNGGNNGGDNGGNNGGDNGGNNGGDSGGNNGGGRVNHNQNNSFDSSATELPKHDSSSVLSKADEKRQQILKQRKIQKGIIIGSVVAVIAIAAVMSALLIRRKRAIAGVSGNAGYSHTEAVPTGVPVPPNQGGPGRFGISLSCRRGFFDGRTIPISEYMTFGRDPSCTVRYPSDYAGVSRNHATLRVQNGKIILIDTSSTGTFLKRTGSAIPKGQPVQLGVGDVFYLGDQNNRFEIVRS